MSKAGQSMLLQHCADYSSTDARVWDSSPGDIRAFFLPTCTGRFTHHANQTAHAGLPFSWHLWTTIL